MIIVLLKYDLIKFNQSLSKGTTGIIWHFCHIPDKIGSDLNQAHFHLALSTQ